MLRIVKNNDAGEFLTIKPEPAAWTGMITARWEVSKRNPEALRVRDKLGLPTDRPVVMSGHQAVVWHPGILAKLGAASSAAARVAGTAAWITVDQDAGDPGVMFVPSAAPERLSLRIAPAPDGEVPTGAQPPMRPGVDSAAALSACDPAVATRASRILATLADHAGAPSAAAQMQASLSDLASPLGLSPGWILASSLSVSGSFAELVEEIFADAAACVRCYNEAARGDSGARVNPLAAEGRIEVPLWRIAPGSARRRVYADERGSIDASALAPRALTMMLLLRRFACDLFIHGTGGDAYDRVTESWIGAWRPGWRLAPTSMVTATRYLPFDRLGPVPTPGEIGGARWLAHAARHNPSLLGDAAAANTKSQFIARIAQARAHGADHRAFYRDMHEFLSVVRSRNAPALAAIDEKAAAMLAQRDRAAVVFDRTWPFPLYPESDLRALLDEIDQAFPSAR